MSTHPTDPDPTGDLELPVKKQLARARTWEPSEEPVVEDLNDEEEAAFLDAISG